ncbi:asparaginase [Halomarina litorea]|uniref:asparaginase n=1 Tax=Halomarina litorea TaxID=2961595 RepID=UPI0020C25C2F|nr:asparaginase [Halomarina sp. BCD28]
MTASVTVLTTGGTIASTGSERGAVPSEDGAALLAAVPGVHDHVDVTVRDVLRRPSFALSLDDVASVVDAVREAVEGGADGVVVTHGTDTMEETAYLLDLVCSLDAPVVLTGAQRRPDELGADGPSNLLTAVRAASHDRLRGASGVYVAFDEALHAARDVTKGHTSALSAFVSPESGPVARVERDGVRFHREPGSRSVSVPAVPTDVAVATVTSGLGASARRVEHALADGVDGIVVEGTGLGNVTPRVGDAVGEAVDRGVPVVVTSRCRAGRVAPVYGTPGGGETLARRGVVGGGDLPAWKARLKLTCVLAALGDDATVESVRDAFEEGI